MNRFIILEFNLESANLKYYVFSDKEKGSTFWVKFEDLFDYVYETNQLPITSCPFIKNSDVNVIFSSDSRQELEDYVGKLRLITLLNM